MALTLQKDQVGVANEWVPSFAEFGAAPSLVEGFPCLH